MIIESFLNKEKILNKFLSIAEIEGWSDDSLKLACAQLQIEEKYLTIIFEEGILSLIEFYVDYYNQKLEQEILLDLDFHQKKISEKINIALTKRFTIEKDNRMALKRIMGFFLNPNNLIKNEIGIKPMTLAFTCLLKVSDNIWKIINDQSVDLNYYSKRVILAKILARVFFVFINDDDVNIIKTKNMIDQQIDHVLTITKLKYRAINQAENFKIRINQLLINDHGILKNPGEILKSLPFFRLIKFK